MKITKLRRKNPNQMDLSDYTAEELAVLLEIENRRQQARSFAIEESKKLEEDKEMQRLKEWSKQEIAKFKASLILITDPCTGDPMITSKDDAGMPIISLPKCERCLLTSCKIRRKT